MKEILLASTNAHKHEEIQHAMSEIRISTLSDYGLENIEIIEDGKTFEENAFIKSREIFKRTGVATIADDSGICIEALEGGPGIYSARFEPELDYPAKKQKIIEIVNKDGRRDAYFVCVIAYVDGEQSFSVRGEVHGTISKEDVGENGFGYDGIFFLEEEKRTFGQLSENEKLSYSHRGRAIEKLREEFFKRKIL